MNRPVGITVLSVIAIVFGVVNLLFALPLLGVSAIAIPGVTSVVASSMLGVGLTLGIVMAILGVVQLAVGIGAFSLKPWAWTVGVLAFGFSLITALVSMFTIGLTGSVAVSAIVAAGLLAYLYSTNVRMAFEHDDGSLFHTSHHTPMGVA
jgi:hypothetical protein